MKSANISVKSLRVLEILIRLSPGRNLFRPFFFIWENTGKEVDLSQVLLCLSEKSTNILAFDVGI